MQIAFVNQKGGVAKSTSAFLIAYSLHQAKKAVKTIDLDPQKSLTAWLGRCDFPQSKDAAYVIVDTPPRVDHANTRKTIAKSDKIILVSTPSPSDIEVSKSTLKFMRELAPNAQIQLLWSMVVPRSKAEKRKDEMAKLIGVTAYEQCITRRLCYQDIPLIGWPALNSSAQKEALALTLEVIS